MWPRQAAHSRVLDGEGKSVAAILRGIHLGLVEGEGPKGELGCCSLSRDGPGQDDTSRQSQHQQPAASAAGKRVDHIDVFIIIVSCALPATPK